MFERGSGGARGGAVARFLDFHVLSHVRGHGEALPEGRVAGDGGHCGGCWERMVEVVEGSWRQ